MTERTFSSNKYRYGFNGKEKDDEVKGQGNQQDYGMRIYDNRLGRFLSVDPLTKKYPELTPYQFASNRPIDGIDLDGLEYESAANFAQNNLIGWAFPDKEDSRQFYFSFNRYKKPETMIAMKNEVHCFESVLLSCARGNTLVADYLSKENIPLTRIEAVAWFKKGGEHHSFIDKDYSQVKRGDILFKGPFGADQGHAAIAAAAPVFSEDGKSFTLDVLSTNTGTDNNYGTKTYTFVLNENKKWVDQASGQILSGFGRIDEKGLTAKQQKEEQGRQEQGKENEATDVNDCDNECTNN